MRDFKNGLLLDAKVASLISWYFFGAAIFIFCTIEPLSIRLFVIGGLVVTWAALVFRISGVQIDYNRKRIRRYTTIFGYKLGKWRPCYDFPFFRVKRIKRHFQMMKGSTITFPCRIRSQALILYDGLNKEDVLLTHELPEKVTEYRVELENKLGIPCHTGNYL